MSIFQFSNFLSHLKNPVVNIIRKIAKGVVALALSLTFIFAVYVAPTQAATHTRHEAHTIEGQKDLASLQRALKKMRALGCQEPASWYYQGAMHWVPTANDEISGIEQDNPLCPSYSGFSNQTEAAAKLLASWNNCTHARNQAGQASTIHFLPWHRLYVYYFESIVRDLSGDPNFSLPYWDYISLFDKTRPDDARLTMPVEFRQPANSSRNALYESARDKGLLDGNPIKSDFADENLLDAVEGLVAIKDYATFNSSINGRPHGVMHNYLGGAVNDETFFNPIYNRTPEAGLMANVPSAGFDPIFWMHHGNIDRLWAQWTNETGVLVTEQELQKVLWPYQFFSSDGAVSGYTMADVIDVIYDLDYNYDDVSTLKPEPVEPQLLAEEDVSLLAMKPQKTRLGALNVGESVGEEMMVRTVPMTIDTIDPMQPLTLINLDAAPSSQPRYILEVTVTYTGRPRGLYKVYLNLPSEDRMSDIDTFFAGTINFFVLPNDRPQTQTFQFDITNELLLQSQTEEGLRNPSEFTISILKQGGTPDETLKIESMAIDLQE